jgi:gamma-glutamyltranspeptidase / glutathione hydrolase
MTALAKHPSAGRPVAMGVNGMVVSAHSLASAAGLGVLADGGNAFDAAVTIGSTLAVVEPHMSGVGGIGVALAYVASEGRTRSLDFSGRAPMAAEPAMFDEDSKDVGPLAPLIPGNVAGWLGLHGRYGSMDLERLLRPAIGYAESGFPATQITNFTMSEVIPRLLRFQDSAALVLGVDGKAPSPGSRIVAPALAASLKAIAAGGVEEFYRGGLARRIAKGVQDAGGLFTEEDMAGYQAEWGEPTGVDYRGYRVITTPPGSAGFQILQALKLMETFGEAELAYMSPDSVHLLVEAIKLAVVDRIAYGGDPDHVPVPLDALLSEEYALAQRGRIDRGHAELLPDVRHHADLPDGALKPGDISGARGETTHFAVADRDSNVVTITQTLGAFYGCGIAPGGTGIFLNNGCTWFDIEEGGPNPVAGGRRVSFVLAPTQVFKGGNFHMSLGTTGGYGIMNTTPQMLMNALDYGMDVQQAIDAPRFSGGMGTMLIEPGIPQDVLHMLKARGHRFAETSDPMGLGSAHGIIVDAEQGVFQGGSDPRRDSAALGL